MSYNSCLVLYLAYSTPTYLLTLNFYKLSHGFLPSKQPLHSAKTLYCISMQKIPIYLLSGNTGATFDFNIIVYTYSPSTYVSCPKIFCSCYDATCVYLSPNIQISRSLNVAGDRQCSLVFLLNIK